MDKIRCFFPAIGDMICPRCEILIEESIGVERNSLFNAIYNNDKGNDANDLAERIADGIGNLSVKESSFENIEIDLANLDVEQYKKEYYGYPANQDLTRIYKSVFHSNVRYDVDKYTRPILTSAMGYEEIPPDLRGDNAIKNYHYGKVYNFGIVHIKNIDQNSMEYMRITKSSVDCYNEIRMINTPMVTRQFPVDNSIIGIMLYRPDWSNLDLTVDGCYEVYTFD